MGLSRVYLGHHWLTDVLVAWALGLGWLTMVITAHRLLLTLQKATTPPDAAPPEPAVRPLSAERRPVTRARPAAVVPRRCSR